MPEHDKYVISGDYVAGNKTVSTTNRSETDTAESVRRVLEAWPEIELVSDGGTYRREPISTTPHHATTTEMVCSAVDRNLNFIVRPVDEFEIIAPTSIIQPIIRNKYALECLNDASWVNFVAGRGQGKSWLLRQAAIKLSQHQLGIFSVPFLSGASLDNTKKVAPFYFDFTELSDSYDKNGNAFDAMVQLISSKRSNYSLYRDVFDSTSPLLLLDNVGNYDENTKEFELIRMLISAIHSNALSGIISTSGASLTSSQLPQACDFTENYLAKPNNLQTARLLHFFGPEIKERIKDKIEFLGKDILTNMRLLRTAAKVVSLGDLEERVDAHRLTKQLLDLAEHESRSEGRFNDRLTLERILKLSWEISESDQAANLIAIDDALKSDGEELSEQHLAVLLAGLVSAGLLIQVGEDRYCIADNRFAHIAVAHRLVADGGARAVFQDLRNDIDGEKTLFAIALAECGHYDVNTLGCIEFVEQYAIAIEERPNAIAEELWLLFFTLIHKIRNSSNFKENDLRQFEETKTAALNYILSESAPISLRTQVQNLSQPVTQDPFRFVEVPSGIVDLGDTESELFCIEKAFWILKFPLSVHEFTMLGGDAHMNSSNSQYPITDVSWVEAMNFCEAHSDTILGFAGLNAKEFRVRLPTEAEWKMAFRGGNAFNGGTNPYPRRAYPWGDEAIVNHANSPGLLVDGRIGLTPNGIWVGNVSPYGVHELVGNCMEWCHTAWGGADTVAPKFGRPYNEADGREDFDVSDLRLALGGSWLFDDASVKCACRLLPDAQHSDVGFRPVAVRREKCYD